LNYFLTNWSSILGRTGEHLSIIGLSLFFASLIGVPLGILIYSREKLENPVITTISIIFTIPSLALFGILVTLLSPIKMGIGKSPAIIAITVYSFLPITRNTLTALKKVNPSIVSAAYGIGMNKRQVIFKMMVPLSLPLIMAGIRNAAVIGVGVGTIAFLIGGGGLGFFIFEGIARTNHQMIVAGTVMIALLGILTNYVLFYIEKLITPKGLKIKK
jgi:osmoprotectant transport system permease protein